MGIAEIVVKDHRGVPTLSLKGEILNVFPSAFRAQSKRSVESWSFGFTWVGPGDSGKCSPDDQWSRGHFRSGEGGAVGAVHSSVVCSSSATCGPFLLSGT